MFYMNEIIYDGPSMLETVVKNACLGFASHLDRLDPITICTGPFSQTGDRDRVMRERTAITKFLKQFVENQQMPGEEISHTQGVAALRALNAIIDLSAGCSFSSFERGVYHSFSDTIVIDMKPVIDLYFDEQLLMKPASLPVQAESARALILHELVHWNLGDVNYTAKARELIGNASIDDGIYSAHWTPVVDPSAFDISKPRRIKELLVFRTHYWLFEEAVAHAVQHHERGMQDDSWVERYVSESKRRYPKEAIDEMFVWTARHTYHLIGKDLQTSSIREVLQKARALWNESYEKLEPIVGW